MKTFEVLIELETVTVTVSARNNREAKKKAIEKLNKKPASKYIDSYGCDKKSKKIGITLIK